jgi:indole-3-glycerol phosphate synthase
MNFLDNIIEKKLKEIELLKSKHDIPSLRRQAVDSPPPRDIVKAIHDCNDIAIIAEIKRASPSRGAIRDIKDVKALARSYLNGGAVAISVVTDGPFFQGSLSDLRYSKEAVDIPLLRKDFIIDPIQIYESRVWGADSILLIASLLDHVRLGDLYFESIELGMTPLIEVHRWEDVQKALILKPPLIGINNRDLSTMRCSIEKCLRLRPMIPDDVIVVGESGIHSHEDITILLEAGVNAFLIGTALMEADDPCLLLRRLRSQGRN